MVVCRPTVSLSRRIGLETLGDRLEQLIAGGVPQGVVDILEVVQVEKEKGERATGPFQLGHRGLQPVVEQEAVGQIGQAVVQGEMLDMGRFRPLALGDFLRQPLDTGNPSDQPKSQ